MTMIMSDYDPYMIRMAHLQTEIDDAFKIPTLKKKREAYVV